MKSIFIIFISIITLFVVISPTFVLAADPGSSQTSLGYCLCNGVCKTGEVVNGACSPLCESGPYSAGCGTVKAGETKQTVTPAVTTKASDGCTTEKGVTTCVLPNPLSTGTTNVAEIIGIIIKGVLGVVGAVSLFMFFWGASSLQGSMGNPEKVKGGVNTMIWAAVGIFVVFVSYMILNLIFTFYLSG